MATGIPDKKDSSPTSACIKKTNAERGAEERRIYSQEILESQDMIALVALIL